MSSKKFTLQSSDKQVIDIIKKIRIEKNLSQQKLAKIAKISTSLINQAELGLRRYSESTAKKLFKTLNFDENLIKNLQPITKSPVVGLRIEVSNEIIDNFEDLRDFKYYAADEIIVPDNVVNLLPLHIIQNPQNVYAISSNFYSPGTGIGDYLLIQFLDSFYLQNMLRDSFVLLLKHPRAGKLIRKVEAVNDIDGKNMIFNAYVPGAPEANNKNGDKNCVALRSGNFYFKEDEVKIIGVVIAAIKIKPDVIILSRYMDNVNYIVYDNEKKIFKFFHQGIEKPCIHGVEIYYKNNGGVMVILTELDENKTGTSITNIYENTATKIYNMFLQNYDHKKIKWIEHYQTPAMLPHYQEVSMDFDDKLKVFREPKWKGIKGIKSYFQK